MAALAHEGVIHRDLAVRNVLVASIDPVHVKVGLLKHDYGSCANFDSNNSSPIL